MSIVYFAVNDVWEIHKKVLKISGGLDGFKDKQAISQVCDFIQNDIYYPAFVDKLAYIIFSISKNHFFNDGNKRTSLAVASYFLLINGYDKKIGLFMQDMEIYIVELVENKINRDDLIEILKRYL